MTNTDTISYTSDGSGAMCAARVMDDLLLAKAQRDGILLMLDECEAAAVAWVTTGQVREAMGATDAER